MTPSPRLSHPRPATSNSSSDHPTIPSIPTISSSAATSQIPLKSLFSLNSTTPPPRPPSSRTSSRRRCRHITTTSSSRPRESIGDESMRAYDAGSIPGMRRPRSDDARVIRWVSDGKIDRLVRHISIRPIAGNTAANALKRQLLCAPVGTEDTLNTLDGLMRRLPYFYRYLATARFFNALWNAYKNRYTNPDVKAKALILIKAWAEDLHRRYIHNTNTNISTSTDGAVDDPAAVFWIEKYQKKRKYTIFPKLPAGIHRPFLCPVNANSTGNGNRNGNAYISNGHTHSHSSSKIAGTVDDLDNLLNIAENDGDAAWMNVAKEARHLYQSVIAAVPPDSPTLTGDSSDNTNSASTFLPSYHEHRHSTATIENCTTTVNTSTTDATLLLPPKRAGRANPKAAKAAVEASRFTALNDKVLTVLRRYDESFARHRVVGDRTQRGSEHGETTNGSAPEINRRCSLADIPVTVAAKARTEARWKLSMSGSGWTSSNNNNNTTKKMNNNNNPHHGYSDDEAASRMDSFSIDSSISFPAITPATFPAFENESPHSNMSQGSKDTSVV